MYVISALAPVFVLVLVGHLLLRFRFAEKDFFHVAAKFAYWIGLPSLLFKNISETTLSLTDAWRVFVMMSIAPLFVAFAGVLAARMFKLDTGRRKTFIHTSFHCNTAFVGLPVILYSLNTHPERKMLIDMASMAVAPMIPIFNIMSIIVMREISLASCILHAPVMIPVQPQRFRSSSFCSPGRPSMRYNRQGPCSFVYCRMPRSEST
jgi:hypothetical protein